MDPIMNTSLLDRIFDRVTNLTSVAVCGLLSLACFYLAFAGAIA